MVCADYLTSSIRPTVERLQSYRGPPFVALVYTSLRCNNILYQISYNPDRVFSPGVSAL